MNKTMKRTLAGLVLSGGAALALTPAVAHADEPPAEAPPVVERITEIVDHPGQTLQDTRTALGIAASAAGSSAKATDSSLTGVGPSLEGAGTALLGGLPSTPSAPKAG
ncbi:hypothetical protein [Streptomyces sp. NPDC051567]|uniref:hypothetical protein n=1 Tax=Streptomyces sp. NPDC051567 TaxID=3365660 RepID=UPI00379792CD